MPHKMSLLLPKLSNQLIRTARAHMRMCNHLVLWDFFKSKVFYGASFSMPFLENY